MSVSRRILSAGLFPFLLSSVSAVACYVAGGASFGLFLGGVLFVTLIVPPLVMAEDLSANRLIVLGAVLSPVSVAWLIGGLGSDVRVGEWISCVLILSAYAGGLAGIAAGLRLARCGPSVAAGLSVVAGLCWLTWPIWLSQTWHGEDSAPAVSRALAFHPAMTINVQSPRLAVWTEQSVAYHLSDLGQDVTYAPTHSIWPTVLLHGLIGGGFLTLAARRERRRRDQLAEPVASTVALSATGS